MFFPDLATIGRLLGKRPVGHSAKTEYEINLLVFDYRDADLRVAGPDQDENKHFKDRCAFTPLSAGDPDRVQLNFKEKPTWIAVTP